MKESIFKNRTVQTVIRLVPAISFTLFTLYQVFLAIFYDASRVGRVIGIAFYLMITIASYLDFSEKSSVWVAHSILLVTGLILLFAMKLLNIPSVFGVLDFDSPATVLYCGVYIFSQLGTLVLIAGYLLLRTDLSERRMQIVMTILMSIAIVLFLLVFIFECILMLKYRLYIEISLKLTFISRALYFLGFAGSALSLMLPAPKKAPEESEERQYIYADDNEEEIDLIL